MEIVIIHSGHYRPVDAPVPKLDEGGEPVAEGFQAPVVVVKQEDLANPALDNPPVAEKPSEPSAVGLVEKGKDLAADHLQDTSPTKDPRVFPSPPLTPYQPTIDASPSLSHPQPTHDLLVTLRVLPRLAKYTGSTRFGISSRGWGSGHEGESLRVEKVVEVPRVVGGFGGGLGGRKAGSRGWALVRNGFLERGVDMGARVLKKDAKDRMKKESVVAAVAMVGEGNGAEASAAKDVEIVMSSVSSVGVVEMEGVVVSSPTDSVSSGTDKKSKAAAAAKKSGRSGARSTFQATLNTQSIVIPSSALAPLTTALSATSGDAGNVGKGMRKRGLSGGASDKASTQKRKVSPFDEHITVVFSNITGDAW
jgi:hypothetical protein